MSILYLDINQEVCLRIEQLIVQGDLPVGDVWCRDLTTVTAEEVRHYTQRHWCCGIGGWSLALKLVGWPDDRPIDTVSLPCQPFSSAGKQKGVKDERHLWPQFYELVKQFRPVVLVGEQVPAAIKHGWLDGVFDALEDEDYACGAVVLPACSIGSPHLRQRIFWGAVSRMGHTRCFYDKHENQSKEVLSADGETEKEASQRERCGGITGGDGCISELGDTNNKGCEGRRLCKCRLSGEGVVGATGNGYWTDSDIISCGDNKMRRIKPGVEPLVNGIPRGMVPSCDNSVAYAENTGEARVARLKGYGNAIVPQVAAVFLRAFDQCIHSV